MKWYISFAPAITSQQSKILFYQLFKAMFEESLKLWIKKHIKNLPNDFSKERIAKSFIKHFLLSQNCSYYMRKIIEKLRKQQRGSLFQKQDCQHVITKEEVYCYLNELIWQQIRLIKQQIYKNAMKENTFDLEKENQDENTRPFPLLKRQQIEKTHSKIYSYDQSQNKTKIECSSINNQATWFGLTLFQNNSFCFYGHLLYGDKIWNILDYHYIENESFQYQKVLVVWKQRKNGITPLSTLLSISQLLYFHPKVLNDTHLNMSLQIREKIQKIRLQKLNQIQ